MTQDEIDALVNCNLSIEPEHPAMNQIRAEKAKFVYNAVVSAKERLTYAREFGTFEEALQAEINLHKAAFRNWLFSKDMTAEDYYALMRREAAKRGMIL